MQSNWDKVASTVDKTFDEATRDSSAEDDRRFVRRLPYELDQKRPVCQSNLNLFIGGVDLGTEQIDFYVSECIAIVNVVK